MKEIVTRGIICLEDEYDFTYYVANIVYMEREDESYCYEITPNYSVISLLTEKKFQGIPGLDLSLRKESYIRENVVPVFISERTPGENREDLWDLLEECDMQYLNRLEWLIRTNTRYAGDGLYVRRPDEKKLAISSIDELGSRSSVISRRILEVICAGGEIVTKDFIINDDNRKSYYVLLMTMYTKERKYLDERRKAGINKAAKQGNYKGRSRVEIDKMELYDIFHAYEDGKISGRDAADKLQISASTFHRRHREYKNASIELQNKNDIEQLT